MPRVSVVIPAYNAEAYLAETLASVAAQTYGDWEVVVADDGSSDDTAAVAAAAGDRVEVLVGVPNAGPAAARNRAVAAARGELLAFLDADDLWLPTYLERLVELYDEGVARGAAPGIVTCDARILGRNGLLAQTYMQLIRFPSEVTLAHMLVSNPIFVSSVVPRALVDEVGGFCPELFGTEDYDLWLRIVELGHRVAVSREALAVYRLRDASVSADSPRMARSFQLTYRRALARGRLIPGQRRVVVRQLRLQRALEQVGLLRREPSIRRLLRALPLFARVAAENPDRWLTAARNLAGRGSPLSQVAK